MTEKKRSVQNNYRIQYNAMRDVHVNLGRFAFCVLLSFFFRHLVKTKFRFNVELKWPRGEEGKAKLLAFRMWGILMKQLQVFANQF